MLQSIAISFFTHVRSAAEHGCTWWHLLHYVCNHVNCDQSLHTWLLSCALCRVHVKRWSIWLCQDPPSSVELLLFDIVPPSNRPSYICHGGTLNTWRSGDDGRAVAERSLVRF
jgi:hypothetical protein